MKGMCSDSVRLFWPSSKLEEERESTDRQTDRNGICRGGTWWVGRRGAAYIGIYCSQETKKEREERKEFAFQTPISDSASEREREREISPVSYYQRRICKVSNHVWVCVVGTTKEFPSLSLFLARCESIEILECVKVKECKRERERGWKIWNGIWGEKREREREEENNNKNISWDKKKMVYEVCVHDKREREKTISIKKESEREEEWKIILDIS
mmetsp:Transcript_1560/g.1639  ORF Transcript_1560/g.1639 Transcript_1560/m.1639 type:complete len:214 (-) Transcript_1560:28-669(-)